MKHDPSLDPIIQRLRGAYLRGWHDAAKSGRGLPEGVQADSLYAKGWAAGQKAYAKASEHALYEAEKKVLTP